jgi:NAD(P)H-hydrate epimerase
VKVVTVEQMRTIEAASDAAGHTYTAMMERAGQAFAEALMAWRKMEERRVLVLVGPGNNGGDGLVAARHLSQAGVDVICYLTRARDPGDDENFRQLLESEVTCAGADDDQGGQLLRRLAARADVVVDALLGTGIELPVKGTVAKVLKAVREVVDRRGQRQPQGLVRLRGVPESSQRGHPLVAAVDGPSGLDFDTGALDESALPADLTVTFAYPKQGHFRFPGAAAVGELVVADIGTDPKLAADISLEVATSQMLRAWLPARPPDAHKGTFGRALIVAGSTNYTGAAGLAGAAAVRGGAGLVTLALPAAIHGTVAAGLAEATYLLLPHELGVITGPAAEILTEHMEEYDAMLVGPGLGREPETASFLERLLTGSAQRRRPGFLHTDKHPSQQILLPPLVVDADGLNILAELSDWPARLPSGTVLTPHPGEMARLMGSSIADIQADRVEAARRQAKDWGNTIVLKGAYTVVAAPDGRTVLEPFANAGLATGGTGDVLAGIIVALRAQGLGPFEAAVAGAYLHGLAGELARKNLSSAGMAAGDLIRFLPQAWRSIGSDQ